MGISKATCGLCGAELKLVQVGKYQGVNKEHECNQPLFENATGKVVGYFNEKGYTPIEEIKSVVF